MSSVVAQMATALAEVGAGGAERDDSRSAEGFGAATVLVADDDPRVRRMIARILKRNGFVVLEAEDGVDALEKAQADRPDLAIVDLRMPRKNGFEVVKVLKTEQPQRPCLVLSGWDEGEDRVQAFDVGADDFVAKPVYMKELLRRIDAFERTRRAYLEVKKANEEADHLRLFVNEAAALLAHDLNNGLSIASVNLQFIDEELRDREDDGELIEAAAAGRRALRRMIGLVANFVDISRLEEAALTPVRFPTKVGDLLRSTAQIHESSRSDGGSIDVQCSDDLVANIDPMLAERVIHNLLNNAVRYVNEGGDICLFGRWDEDGTSLFLGVANTGSRIPAEIRANLFDKYRKGPDGKAQRGMGLYFCHLACEAHGGSIALRDHEHFETYFAIRLAEAREGCAAAE